MLRCLTHRVDSDGCFQVDPAEILAAERAVLEGMKEHKRLLKLMEEILLNFESF